LLKRYFVLDLKTVNISVQHFCRKFNIPLKFYDINGTSRLIVKAELNLLMDVCFFFRKPVQNRSAVQTFNQKKTIYKDERLARIQTL